MPLHTQLEASDGHKLEAYVTQPTGEPKAGIIVIPEIFGITAHIHAVADHFAQAGYLVIAPALFDRVEKNFDLNSNSDSVRKGMQIARRIPPEDTLADIDAALQYLQEHGAPRVGAVGYCWGGTFAWLSNTRLRLDATVSYYPGRIQDYIDEKPNAPAMFHFGLLDKNIPQSVVEKLQRAHPESSIFTYDAGHGFNNDTRDSYDEEAATEAPRRTLAHLDKYLVSKPH